MILVFPIMFGNKSRILLICRTVSFHPFDLFGLPSLTQRFWRKPPPPGLPPPLL